MESYLADIDAYMHEQAEQEEQKQQQQQQQQQQQHFVQPEPQLFPDLNTAFNNDLWFDELPIDPLPVQSNYIPSPIFLSDSSQFNIPNPAQTNYIVPQFIPTEPASTARKKPGRKPTHVPPALRKAQNRAAQRAFRERKERHLKDLENTIRHLREQCHNMQRELDQTRQQAEGFKVETWYLKGIVLTLQFVCMYHNIKLPTHAPYLSEEALSHVAKTSPHILEAYVDAYTRNNTLIASTVNERLNKKQTDYTKRDEREVQNELEQQQERIEKEQREEQKRKEEQKEEIDISMSHDLDEVAKEKEEDEDASSLDQKQSSMDAIEYIRSKLGVDSDTDPASAGLRPTILQIAIPHDPRIDLVPAPHLRDRMIVFRNLMDYDRCFSILFRKCVFHGGDPTNHKNWELPLEFFSEFWYLFLEYDIKRTNDWRRLKGLSEITSGPQSDMWTGKRTSDAEQQTIYDLLLRQPPETRKPLDPPTLENIIERMTSL